MVCKFNQQFDRVYDSKYLEDIANLSGSPFATSIVSLFNKSQALTGYGCALAEIMDNQIINDIKNIYEYIDKISLNNFDSVFVNMMNDMDYLRRNAKKIGNDQRKYFYFFFLSLFSKDKYSFLNFELAAKQAFEETK